MTVAWVFPGQGSQKIGMAKMIEDLPNAKERFSYASEIFERNLFEICELNSEPTNPLEDLNNTRNTQICLFLVESILLDALRRITTNQIMLLVIVLEKLRHFIPQMSFHSKILYH